MGLLDSAGSPESQGIRTKEPIRDCHNSLCWLCYRSPSSVKTVLLESKCIERESPALERYFRPSCGLQSFRWPTWGESPHAVLQAAILWPPKPFLPTSSPTCPCCMHPSPKYLDVRLCAHLIHALGRAVPRIATTLVARANWCS